jgi:hypothetical protein
LNVVLDAPQRSRKRRHVIIATGVRSPSHAESEHDGNEYGGLPANLHIADPHRSLSAMGAHYCPGSAIGPPRNLETL